MSTWDECGAQRCPRCGLENPLANKFCSRCGVIPDEKAARNLMKSNLEPCMNHSEMELLSSVDACNLCTARRPLICLLEKCPLRKLFNAKGL